jgi:hypothetical protein
MRRPLAIALASLFVAALVASTARAATRRYDFQGGFGPQLRISVVVFYKNKHRHGAFTPRQAIYDSSVPISCNPPVSGHSEAPSGSYILGTPDYTFIKVRKGSFSYSYSYEIPTSITGGAPGSTSATATGKVIKKKRKEKKLRVDGSVSILNYSFPPFGWQNCTSGGPVPYSATPCRLPYTQLPYIKKSLPVCWADV